MIKKWIGLLLASGIVTVGLFFVILWVKFLFTPLIQNEEGYKYTVQPGNSIKTVINDLYFKNIIHNRIFLQLLVRLRGDGQELKSGEYFFPKGTTPPKMLNQMMTGTGLSYRAFTIIPGWNFKDLRHALQQENSVRHTLQKLDDQQLMSQLGQPGILPEGQFFPDTYYFAVGISDVALLKRASETMQKKLQEAWQTRAPDLPYTMPYEVLIAASLVEKEAYLNEERPIIAGVLVNRLRKDMLLQIDPTVIYGMGSRYDGKIRKEDLLENTPYNTYVNKGLPPGPIAMPSMDSIIAVLHPENNNYLYYVARGDGSHQFSETYIEHQAAVIETFKLDSAYLNNELLRYYLQKIFFKQVYTL